MVKGKYIIGCSGLITGLIVSGIGCYVVVARLILFHGDLSTAFTRAFDFSISGHVVDTGGQAVAEVRILVTESRLIKHGTSSIYKVYEVISPDGKFSISCRSCSSVRILAYNNAWLGRSYDFGSRGGIFTNVNINVEKRPTPATMQAADG